MKTSITTENVCTLEFSIYMADIVCIIDRLCPFHILPKHVRAFLLETQISHKPAGLRNTKR